MTTEQLYKLEDELATVEVDIQDCVDRLVELRRRRNELRAEIDNQDEEIELTAQECHSAGPRLSEL